MKTGIRSLRGRVVLVLGAGERTARATALRLAAHGAAVVAAGRSLDEVITTAGLVAASGGVARVIEQSAPPLLGRELLAAAAGALEAPTDAVVSAHAFPSLAEAQTAARALAASLPPGAEVHVIDGGATPGGEAERVTARFLGRD